ncbi:hypothetical protein P9W99_05030 [Bacillus cereus]|uniref:Uncharacterized protein n=2 Tax=Bacillus cereus group TaxID=86661 RepID=A0A9W5QCK3_BACCE|nr:MULTISPECIES: hypothetical protein [Bacillus]AIE37072.1 hypothetical protein BTK_33736 [Bacillus thuringiensis serovar kurstaki str. HD-1]AJK38478.1 hypothetical protein BG08_6832 [Bacillus thuringiensis serovar kurstaki]AKJ62933.1 hypothetical protein XI92_32835 [Bacillus thuringiensis]ALL62466.1 hypothetical protein AQ980_31640 [Bacillus thuringiensis]AMX80661.1 hypothetical protein BtBc_30155 [Bacillus thuringiensis]
MSEVVLSDTAKFKITRIHNDIVEEYLQQHPEYKTKADVFRRAIGLLDEDMRKEKGEDDVSLLKKEVKGLTQAVNTMKQQMDILIKLNMELIARSGSDLSLEELEQEVKSEIASAVTKKSEGKFSRTVKREPIEVNMQEQEHIQREVKTPSFAKKTLPMITDDVQIVMKKGKPHKAISRLGQTMYEEIEWEQIPEHRRKELT